MEMALKKKTSYKLSILQKQPVIEDSLCFEDLQLLLEQFSGDIGVEHIKILYNPLLKPLHHCKGRRVCL